LGVNTVTGEGLAQALAGAQVVVVYGSSQAIHIARELNPKLVIFARSSYLSGLPELRKAGADIVFSSEGEIALAMTEFLLRQLGATSEQVDRERARIRSEFFSGSKDNEPLPQDRLRPPSEAETQTQEHESAGRG